MKIGDEVIISDKNPNHLGYGVSAYAGMKGIVIELYDDNGFCLDCNGSTLVVPLVIYGKPEGIWIWLNQKLIYHKGKKICLTNTLKNQDIHVKSYRNCLVKILATLKEKWFKILNA